MVLFRGYMSPRHTGDDRQMKTRIHLVLDELEREAFRMQAKREGLSLSRWLRDAAAQKLAAAQERKALDTLEELEAFFRSCDERETGREPEWREHRGVIETSARSGGSGT